MKKLLLSLLALFCVGLLACSSAEEEILASTAPVQQFAQAVCRGTDLKVGLLVSEPVSCVHDYSLSTAQMMKLEKADLVLLSGADLEVFMQDALASCRQVLTCDAGVKLLAGEEEGEFDPHIWLSPENARIMTRNIAKGLSALYPDYADTFLKNAELYCDELSNLELEAMVTLQGIPCTDLVTFHDGFAYFADAFGLEILAAIEEEAGAEASAKDLKEITELVRDAAIPAIFVEKDGSDAAARIIAGETGCKVGTLSTGLADRDYFETIRGNALAIKEAFS